MSEAILFPWLLRGWLALAGAVFVILLFVAAPYGRHARPGWGPSVDATLGWVLMELPAVLGMAFFFAVGGRTGWPALVFLALWQLHYLHRTFVFPFRRRGASRRNLVPRALAHHRWYRRRFADYPEERKALIPWLL